LNEDSHLEEVAMNNQPAGLSQEAQTSPANADGNGSQPTSRAFEIQLPEAKQFSTPKLAKAERIDQPPIHKSTGPRTEPGKKRSSQNAIKSGIFSRATLLNGESRSDYNSLLEGLWETLQPEGKLEELLVEKLGSISWRYRRLLVAEGAEIRQNSEFLEFDRRQVEQNEVEEISHRERLAVGPAGMIWKIRNPDVLERCLELLVELRQRIKADGFDEEQDGAILQAIYGVPTSSQLRRTLQDEYLVWHNTAEGTEEERQSEGYATPEQCRQNVLRLIDAEIARLKQYQQKRESIESKRRKVEILRQSVPDSRGLDRLLRYESSLERALDRTLNQLERAQRIRKGQPLPPQVDVKIS
jgi:hypothetical protein